MPNFYEYRCDDCGLAYESQTFARLGHRYPDLQCPDCAGPLIRVASLFNVSPSPEPYFNHAVGQMVTSNKDFEEKLRVGAMEQSERLGVEHRYAPLYPAELKAHAEKSAGNDGQSGESVEQYTKANHTTTRKIIT